MEMKTGKRSQSIVSVPSGTAPQMKKWGQPARMIGFRVCWKLTSIALAEQQLELVPSIADLSIGNVRRFRDAGREEDHFEVCLHLISREAVCSIFGPVELADAFLASIQAPDDRTAIGSTADLVGCNRDIAIFEFENDGFAREGSSRPEPP